MFSASFSMAEDPVIYQDEIEARYLQDRYPEYYRHKNEAARLKEEIKESWKKPNSRSERQNLEKARANAEEKARRIRTQAIHELRDTSPNNVNSTTYQKILSERKSPQATSSSGDSKFKQENEAWHQKQKPIFDAQDARLEALKVNADPKSTSYFVMDEAAKGTPGYITELKLTAQQKAQVIQAAEDYNKLLNPFKGTSADDIYDRLKVISQGEMGSVKSAEDFKKILSQMSDLNRKLESATSKEELLATAKELKSLTSPHTKALTTYFGQTDYKITFGGAEPFIDKGNDRIFLDEVGKVKRIVKSGGSKITGATNIKKALVTLGLSATALSVSAGAMADEAVNAAASEPTKTSPANFKAKDWVDGAR